MAEWSKAIGCKLIESFYVGSNPTSFNLNKNNFENFNFNFKKQKVGFGKVLMKDGSATANGLNLCQGKLVNIGFQELKKFCKIEKGVYNKVKATRTSSKCETANEINWGWHKDFVERKGKLSYLVKQILLERAERGEIE